MKWKRCEGGPVNPEIVELDRKGLQKFAWMFSIVVAILFGLILPWFLNRDWSLIPWVVAMLFFVWGLIAPSTVRPFYRVWTRFGLIMNAIITRIILAAVFYIAILPFGIVFRLRGKDLMDRKWDHELHSYRVTSRKTNNRQMERPF